jgi:hypothetical protein
MKKVFFALLLSVLCLLPYAATNFCFAEENERGYVVTANQASVFAEASLTSEKIATLEHKDEIEIEFENGSAKIFDGDGYSFYLTTNLEQNGYVLVDLVVPKKTLLVTIPSFNAQTNDAAKVYFLSDEQYVESEITLQKSQRIFLYQGYDSKKDFIAVAFVYENEVVYGYLEKSVISPDGINPTILTVTILIIALLGIIFALVFMKKKKKTPKITVQK